MTLTIPYGNEPVSADLTWARLLGILDVAEVPELPRPEEAIRQAVENPIGLDRNLYEIVRPGESVVLLVSDMFRQTRADQFLPVLVDGLSQHGVADEAVSILFSTGTHRTPTVEEQARIVGDAVFRRFRDRLFVHDAHNESELVFLGTTSRGTPVKINRRAYEADRVIATGTVILHYFGGYGGGRKSVVPGIAGVETIAHNHALNLDPCEDRLRPEVRIGVLDGNPVAEDMLEATRLTHVDYILNTVLNRHAQIAAVFAGELDAAHRAAATFAHDLFTLAIPERADLVIASSGAARNFVQSHKALYNAYQAVKPDGRVIFLTRCEEGLGGEQFAQWLRVGSRAEIIAALRQRSEINGQTALSTIEKAPVTLFVTDLPETDVRLLRGRKALSLDQALALAHEDLKHVAHPTCYLMPSASHTVPRAPTGVRTAPTASIYWT